MPGEQTQASGLQLMLLGDPHKHEASGTVVQVLIYQTAECLIIYSNAKESYVHLAFAKKRLWVKRECSVSGGISGTRCLGKSLERLMPPAASWAPGLPAQAPAQRPARDWPVDGTLSASPVQTPKELHLDIVTPGGGGKTCLPLLHENLGKLHRCQGSHVGKLS